MSLRLPKLASLIVLAALAITPAKQTTAQPTTGSQLQQVAKAPFEVRLRKLHLVRPDLIPYPINFEVYC